MIIIWSAEIIGILSFVAVLVMLKLSFPYLAPFYLGLSIALILDGPISYLERRGWPRSFVSVLMLTIVLLGLPSLLTLFVYKLWQEFSALLFVRSFFSLNELWTRPSFEFLERVPTLLGDYSPLNLLDLTVRLFRWALAIPDVLLIWSLGIVSAFFFSRDKKILSRILFSQFHEQRKLGFHRLYRRSSGAVWHLLKVRLILIAATMSFSMLVFHFLGLAYPLVLGLLVAFFDLVPILGPGLVYLSQSVFHLWLGNYSLALALGLCYLILLLVRQWAEPYLLGGPLGLHPLIALIGLYLGFRIWGVFGALISPILLVVIQALLGSSTFIFDH